MAGPLERIALVTGSARGLGLAAARRLAQDGDRVHVVWRSSGDEVLEREFPGRVHRADLGQPGAAEELVRSVLAVDGRLDVLVHAVGEYLRGPLSETGPDDLRRMLGSNVESAFAVAAAARAALRDASGALVFFGCGGLAGLRGRRETAAYAAAKSALLVLMRSIAIEEAPWGVRANMVSPGLVPHEHASPDTLDPDLQARIPFGRPGRPDEVAEAVSWLASDAAGYVTGTDLAVGGGWMV